MTRNRKPVVIFPANALGNPELNPVPHANHSERSGSYLEYLLELADRLLKRAVDDEPEAA